MQDMELPAELVQRFRDGRVTLFIGAGCCRSAGLPGWEDLLRRIEHQFNKENLLNKNDQGNLRKWFTNVNNYPRIAELFKNRSPQRYRDLMQSIFDPGTRSRAFKPPQYFYIFRQLPITRILTTNFDKLLEDALGLQWGSLTWQDQDELPRYLRDQRLGFILHIHGRADRFGTLVHAFGEYQSLQGLDGAQTREFIKRIFETDTILSIGYRLGDPVINWLEDQLRSTWSIDPDWYSLVPIAKEERTRERRERNIRLIGYQFDTSLPPDTAHEFGLSEWFRQLARELEVPHELPRTALDSADEPESGCVRIDSAFLDRQPPATSDLACAYYRGEPVRWNLVRAGLTARRRATGEALDYLKSRGLRTILLTGAGGEGKTTILFQIGLALLDDGWTVIHLAEPTEPTSDLFDIVRRQRNPLAILMDRADEFRHLKRLLREVDRREHPTALVLAARPHEWKEAHRELGDLARLLKEIRIGKLTPEEARDIAKNLLQTKAIEKGTVDSLAERLLQDTNGFLLAAMLTTTHGESLSHILANVIKRISDWEEGDELLTAIASVVALEGRRDDRGNSYWCSLRLLTEALGASTQKVTRLCARLVGEVSLRIKATRQVETRHPKIAEALFPILFRADAPPVDELKIHERILRAAGTISREYVNPGERKLLSIIPLAYVREGDVEKARHLFQVAAESDPRQAPIWQAWARLEERECNIGAADQPETARWLFKKATEADSKNAPAWQAWALLERNERNSGSIEKPNTARWLFKNATEADPEHVPSWQAWALLERDERNIGSIGKPYTARWLFKKATETDPRDAPSWQAWALLERDERNIGSIDQPYTARWLFKKATEADHRDAPAWQAWALLERDEGNLGNVNQPHTARWLFKKATEVDPTHAPSWQAWADSERRAGSLTEASRILSEGLKRCPDAPELIELQKKLCQISMAPQQEIRQMIETGEIEGAERVLKDALFVNPTDSQLLELHRLWREAKSKLDRSAAGLVSS